jgi:Ni/Co efflux regulator RcnB
MKTLFIAASVLALAVSAPAAQAQEEHHPGGGGGAPHGPAAPAQHAAPAGPRGGGEPGGGQRPAPGARAVEGPRAQGPRAQGPRPEMARPETGGPRGPRPSESRANHAISPAGRGPAGRGAEAVGPGGVPHQAGRHERVAGANSAPGGRPGVSAGARSPAVAALRRNVPAARRFHVGGYRPPQGYAPRRWGFGQRLPHGYFARNYWISNYWAYALFAPPSGLVWVRVGDDALLIDEYSGEIIQVDYGVFY